MLVGGEGEGPCSSLLLPLRKREGGMGSPTGVPGLQVFRNSRQKSQGSRRRSEASSKPGSVPPGPGSHFPRQEQLSQSNS